ncbi:MAG: Fe(3+) ABC transporter substrate-binding protein [Kiloniellales bacterium]|nr:Fe(3+) ABC transporter substrate-binding protein [Kiloniellales bacterium]
MKALLRGLAVLVSTVLPATGAVAEEVLNLYSSRHYQTDEALYEDFTKATGIKINRIEGKGDALIERIKSEGANSPADILLTVDAGRLWRAEQAGLFQPVESKLLDEVVPANLRHPEGLWYGFSTRARLIYYAKDRVQPDAISRYEELADPKWKGKICIRSSSNIYNQSLMGSIIAAHGEKAAEDWANGVVANFARGPQGGDTDQIRAVAAGECDIAVGNSYYYVRLMTKPKDADKDVAGKVGWIFPNQGDRGTHVNVSGAGVLKNAPNKAAAVKFLEYLASDRAQRYFADGNNEYPVAARVEGNSAVESLGKFKVDQINVAVYGENQPEAQKIFDRAGWK